jgi:hypothetical protein
VQAHALYRRQHFGDGGAAAVERLVQARLVGIERLQPLFGVADLALEVADA